MTQSDFFIQRNDDRRPWEAAVDWLLEQNLKPGDEIHQASLSTALGMIDPETLNSRSAWRQWELRRLPEAEQAIEKFEAKSGLTLIPTHKGSYLVLDVEEVGRTLFPIYERRVKAAMRWITGKLKRATVEGVSAAERQRRNSILDHVSNARSWMGRERRKSLDDVL